MSDTDRLELIQAFLKASPGNSTPQQILAWSVFYDTHSLMLRSIVQRCHVHARDVEDAVQDIWGIVVDKLPTWHFDERRGSLDAWLASIAYHYAAKYARRSFQHRCVGLTHARADMLPDDRTSLEAEALHNERRELVRAVIEEACVRLPDLSRRITVLYWSTNRSMSAIAAELNISEHAVRMRLHRVRKLLRVLLRAREGELF